MIEPRKYILWKNCTAFGVLPHTEHIENILKQHLYDEKDIIEFAIVEYSSIEKVNLDSDPEANIGRKLIVSDKENLIIALNKTGFHQENAAKLLNISSRSVSFRIRKFGLLQYVQSKRAEMSFQG